MCPPVVGSSNVYSLDKKFRRIRGQMGALRIRLNFLLGMDWGNPMKCHSTRSFCRYFLGKDWDPIFRDNFCQQFPNVLSVVDGVAELPKLILQDFVVEGLILPNVDQVVLVFRTSSSDSRSSSKSFSPGRKPV